MRAIFTIRGQNHPDPDALYLDLRAGRRELRRGPLHIQLPLRQFKFVQALMANHPKPMTHWELFYHIWGEGSEGRFNFTDEDGGPLTPANCIQQYAAKLRIKLAHMGISINAPRKGYGYEINEIEEAPADTSGQEAEAPRDPRGSKAGVPRKQVLKPVPDTGDHPSGITLTVERVGVRR